MLSFIFKRFSDRPYKKFIKRSQPTIARINELDEQYKRLSDAELRDHTVQFRSRLEAGETLDDILPEAFATVKNAARRMCGQTYDVSGQKLDWNMVHYDVQLIGGLSLHQGMIAEMATGEGKTLVATLPLYLNALPGLGCHCVTVNDYLAKRDSEWMGYLFQFLGLTVGCIQNSMALPQKKEMYQADITCAIMAWPWLPMLRSNGGIFSVS
jgi:preprotein translocase subunit SecA